MSGYNIATDTNITPVNTLDSWVSTYSDTHLEYSHDQSQLILATPDDAVLVIGPPRLNSTDSTNLGIVGFLNNLNYNENAQVQPLKAIGSRRHIFSRTNAPVQGSIARMLLLGRNLFKILYSVTDLSGFNKTISKWSISDSKESSLWYANMEEDIFRVPFGLGVVYSSPANRIDQSSLTVIGGEYIEVCSLVSKQSSIMAGQAMVMENVSFVADRIRPFTLSY